jgi:hypothetical protein
MAILKAEIFFRDAINTPPAEVNQSQFCKSNLVLHNVTPLFIFLLSF